jgi:hypothetical protein
VSISTRLFPHLSKGSSAAKNTGWKKSVSAISLRNLSLRFGMVKVMKISETALRIGKIGSENSISRFGMLLMRGIFKRLDYQNLQSPAKRATKFLGFNFSLNRDISA